MILGVGYGGVSGFFSQRTARRSELFDFDGIPIEAEGFLNGKLISGGVFAPIFDRDRFLIKLGCDLVPRLCQALASIDLVFHQCTQTLLLLDVTDLTFSKRDTDIVADDVPAREIIFAQSVDKLVFEIVDLHFKFSLFATDLGDIRSE